MKFTKQNKKLSLMKRIKNNLLNFKIWFITKYGQNSLYLGLLRAYSISTLPVKVEKYYNHIFFIIFRVIGGISVLMVLSNFYLDLPNVFTFLCVFVACIHITLVFIIFIIKTFYSLYILIFRREKFEIRN